MKKLAVLQVAPYEPNEEHIKLFTGKKDTSFYFVTHDKENENAIGYLPNSDWAETRNLLYEKVPKKYEYYAFIDYDYNLISNTEKNFKDQVIEDLEKVHPGILAPYPGKGNMGGIYPKMVTGNYNYILFSHVGLKIVHHSLMDWFLPMLMKFGGGFSACHYWNILEIPFMEDIIMTHNVQYENTISNSNSNHNKDREKFLKMSDMYKWIKPHLNFNSGTDVMDVKRVWANKAINTNNSNILTREKKDNFFNIDIIKSHFKNIEKIPEIYNSIKKYENTLIYN